MTDPSNAHQTKWHIPFRDMFLVSILVAVCLKNERQHCVNGAPNSFFKEPFMRNKPPPPPTAPGATPHHLISSAQPRPQGEEQPPPLPSEASSFSSGKEPSPPSPIELPSLSQAEKVSVPPSNEGPPLHIIKKRTHLYPSLAPHLPSGIELINQPSSESRDEEPSLSLSTEAPIRVPFPVPAREQNPSIDRHPAPPLSDDNPENAVIALSLEKTTSSKNPESWVDLPENLQDTAKRTPSGNPSIAQSQVDGVLSDLAEPAELPEFLNTCPASRYGSGCALECHCKNARPCHQEQGVCPASECAQGFIGKACNIQDHMYEPLDIEKHEEVMENIDDDDVGIGLPLDEFNFGSDDLD